MKTNSSRTKYSLLHSLLIFTLYTIPSIQSFMITISPKNLSELLTIQNTKRLINHSSTHQSMKTSPTSMISSFTSSLHQTSTSSSMGKPNSSDPVLIKILALHGKGDSANEFQSSLQPLVSALEEQSQQSSSGALFQFQFDFLNAPFEGGQWWTLPPGVRSFNAKTYEGFERSAKLIGDALWKNSSGYDLILGHSQGAILVSALISMGEIFHRPPKEDGDEDKNCILNPPLGVILNGAAWPNPYTDLLETFTLQQSSSVTMQRPKALFVIGEADNMNPPQGAKRVRESLERSGMKIDTCSHPGGHSVPTRDEKAVKEMVNWIVMVAEEKVSSQKK